MPTTLGVWPSTWHPLALSRTSLASAARTPPHVALAMAAAALCTTNLEYLVVCHDWCVCSKRTASLFSPTAAASSPECRTSRKNDMAH